MHGTKIGHSQCGAATAAFLRRNIAVLDKANADQVLLNDADTVLSLHYCLGGLVWLTNPSRLG